MKCEECGHEEKQFFYYDINKSTKTHKVLICPACLKEIQTKRGDPGTPGRKHLHEVCTWKKKQKR